MSTTQPTPSGESAETPEPDVRLPFPKQYGAPPCPDKFCGYRCGCCCWHSCQTPCPTPDEDGDCACEVSCHGGHQPWDCLSHSTRYRWAKAKAERLEGEGTCQDARGSEGLTRILEVLDEFRAWMHSEAHDGHGARRWGVQHVLDHYDERTSDAIRAALSGSNRPQAGAA